MSKILKITFEYENEIHILEDKQAEEWLQKVNSMCAFSAIHGNRFPEFNWKIIKKKQK